MVLYVLCIRRRNRMAALPFGVGRKVRASRKNAPGNAGQERLTASATENDYLVRKGEKVR